MKKLLLFSVSLCILLAGCSKTNDLIHEDGLTATTTLSLTDECDPDDYTSPCGSNGAYAIVRGQEYYFKSVTTDPGTEFESTKFWTITDYQSQTATRGFALSIPAFAGKEVNMTFFSVWRHEKHTLDKDGYCYVDVSRWGGVYEQVHISCSSVESPSYVLHIDFGWRPSL